MDIRHEYFSLQVRDLSHARRAKRAAFLLAPFHSGITLGDRVDAPRNENSLPCLIGEPYLPGLHQVCACLVACCVTSRSLRSLGLTDIHVYRGSVLEQWIKSHLSLFVYFALVLGFFSAYLHHQIKPYGYLS